PRPESVANYLHRPANPEVASLRRNVLPSFHTLTRAPAQGPHALWRTDRTINAAIRRSELIRIGRGWYSTPPTIFHSMMSLIMPRYPASVFSHRTAAWLHGFRQSMPTRP